MQRKSTYAEKLRHQEHAVMLSCDEVMLSLFDKELGDQHDEIAKRTQDFLFRKSLEILDAGISVILEWGFWTKAARNQARQFYERHGVPCEFHYVAVTDDQWNANIAERNRKILNGESSAYFVDEGLARKFASLFVEPDPREIDVWYLNEQK